MLVMAGGLQTRYYRRMRLFHQDELVVSGQQQRVLRLPVLDDHTAPAAEQLAALQPRRLGIGNRIMGRGFV